MSYQTNTIERGTILEVQGTPYGILPAFGDYPELTVDEYRSLSDDGWQARLNAFYDMVSAITGFDVRDNILAGQEASRVNTTGCAVNTYYRVDATAVNGTAEGGGIYKVNDPVTLQAKSDTPGRIFLGWFSSDVLVSDEEIYSFLATQDIALEARYSAVYSVTVNGAGDFQLEVGYAGSSVSVTVASMGAGWTLASVPSFVAVSPTSAAEGSTSVTLTVQPNPSTAERGGTVVFKNMGLASITATVTVTQDGDSRIDNPIGITASVSSGGGQVTATSTYAVASDVTVTGEWQDDLTGSGTFTITIPAAESVGSTIVELSSSSVVNMSATATDVIPTSDDTYSYLIN